MKAEYFIYVGNAYPHKNLENLIQAMVILNSGLNRIIKLKIVSSRNVFTQRLKEYILKTKSEKFVDLSGFVEDGKLRQLYSDSTAFIFPSRSEGFGLPGIEAMRANALVLASDLPVFREVYENNSLYFDSTNINSIVNSMNKVIFMDTLEKNKRIKRASEFVKKYSWSKMAKETLEVYEKYGITRD